MFCPNPECIDYEQDGVPGEYVDTVTTCPKCRTALVPELPPGWPGGHGETFSDDEQGRDEVLIGHAQPVHAEPLGLGTFVPLAAYDYPDEADPLLEHLTAASITAVVLLDDGRDFQDKGGVATCSRVLVPEGQYRAASSILAALDRA
ncbi:MAG: hypothetical protein AB2L07_21675 [Thermoanaerobaculaceae bacterium]